MLRLLPIVLLLVFATSAQAATVNVPVPADGQIAVAVAKVGKKATVKAKAPAGIAVTGSAKKGRLAVAVVHRRGVIAGGKVTLQVKGKVRGLKIGRAPGAHCTGLAALLSKPLQRAGLASGDLRALGAATAAKVCGKPFSQALLDRLGLGAAPTTSGSLAPPGSARPSPSPGGGGATNQCSNGVDDDGDGQVDAPSERRLRPDPGCMNANDSTEAGEVPLNCNAGAGVGDDPSQLQIGINDGCGSFVEVAVYAAPTAFVCDIGASAGNWSCVIAHGQAFAETRNATDAEMADLTIGLNAGADCAVPATIVLTRRNFEVAELVTPIAGCGQAAPACSNGQDDDGDGTADALVRRRPRPRLLRYGRRERGLGGRAAGGLHGRRRPRQRRPAVPGRQADRMRLGRRRLVQAVGDAGGVRLRDRRRRRADVHGHRRHGRGDVRGHDGGRPARRADHDRHDVRAGHHRDRALGRARREAARRLVLTEPEA
jgi:hypothetical protein